MNNVKVEALGVGRFNRMVFHQDKVWLDYFGREHQLSKMDREYAQTILNYLDRKHWWARFDEGDYDKLPLIKALRFIARSGRPERWYDRLRHKFYWLRRNRIERG